MPYSALFLDAGHGHNPQGGIDHGAVGNGTTEREQVVAICRGLLPLVQELPIQALPVGVETEASLPDKIKYINEVCAQKSWGSGDALLVSVHMNAGPVEAHGVEAWYSSRKPAQIGLAQTLAQSVAKASGLPLRSPSAKPSADDRLGRLGILDDTVPEAVLVEIGFVTNPTDTAVVEQHASVIQGLYQGLLSCLHLPPPSMDAYSDIPAGAWYTDAVNFCLQEGVVEMPADHLFHPDEPATRAELAVMIARLLHRQP